MYKHFSRQLMMSGDQITVFFDPEPAGNTSFYHAKFWFQGNDHHIVFFINPVGEWEIMDRDTHQRFIPYEQQFVFGIKYANSMTDNL